MIRLIFEEIPNFLPGQTMEEEVQRHVMERASQDLEEDLDRRQGIDFSDLLYDQIEWDDLWNSASI